MRGKDHHSTVPFLRCLLALIASFQVPAVKECFNVSDPGTSGISRSYAEALIADDPELQKSIRGLEAMLRVRDSLGSGRGPPLVSASLPVCSGAVENDAVPALLECAAGSTAGVNTDITALLEGRKSDLSRTHGVAGAAATAGETEEITALLEVRESDLTKMNGMAVAGATAGATPGESQRIIGLRERYESDFPSLNSSGCFSVDACASLPAVPGVSARVCPVSSFSAVSAAVAHALSTPMHDAHNSCSDTAMNSLSYNPQGVVPLNSRRKVRQSCTVRSRSAEQIVDMSPASAAGTYRRSAGTVHDQRQVSRKRLAGSSVVGAGPGPGPGGWSGLVGGALDHTAACLGIPCSLVMPPGRHQHAPQSLGWARVCGTERSGVWVLKGDARTL